MPTVRDIEKLRQIGDHAEADRLEAQLKARRKYQRDHHKANQPLRTVTTRNRYQSRKAEAVAMKGGRCADCGGVFPPCVYDFHHIGEKTITLQNMARYTWDTITAELGKCEMLCANCHRIRHHYKGE